MLPSTRFAIPFGRPIVGAPMWLPVVLVLAWTAILIAASVGACRPRPVVSTMVLAIVTVCIVFWCSHLRHAPLRSLDSLGRMIAGGLADLVRLAVYVFLVALPVLFLASSDGCVSPREIARMLAVSVDPVRAEIESRAMAGGSLAATGRGLSVPRQGRVDSAVVTDNGTIEVRSVAPQVVLLLMPEMVRGVVHWRCVTVPDVGLREACVHR